ncbi:MAG: amidohydrolase family protein [Pseudomonadota bacterium]
MPERKSSRHCRHSLLLLLGLLSTSGPVFGDTLIHAGALFDAERGKLLRERTIRIQGNRVAAVNSGYIDAAVDDVVIDLRTATVLPGLIDMHVHIASQQSPSRFVDRFRLGPADLALRATTYAERTVMAGFTTVRDLGTEQGVALALSRAVREGSIIGPRIFTAGKAIATTGGHGDPSNGLKPSLRGDPGPAEGVVNSPAEGAKAVRARYKEGAHLIKITATGGVLSEARSADNPQFAVPEIEAIVATAKDYGFKVAAHAHGASGMKRAVEGGVDSIEHGTYMTDEIMALMRKRGVHYVPTILAGRFVADKAEVPGYFSELVRPKAAAIGPLIQETFGRAYRAGVPIAFGTDSGVSAHGDNWLEFGYMVEAGMPPAETLIAATATAAALLGRSDELGRIKAGLLADIVAVPGNPLRQIERMADVFFVMQDGIVLRHDEPVALSGAGEPADAGP